MAFSMYDLSVPILLRHLNILSGYLDLAKWYAEEHAIEESVLVQARLAPDMMSLAGQVQRASDNAKAGISRLTGLQAPFFPDTERTLEELMLRIEHTESFLKDVTPAQLCGSESRPVDLRFRSVSGVLRGDTYLLTVLLPNFFFHVTTAHNILRHNGMSIGKKDYFGVLTYL